MARESGRRSGRDADRSRTSSYRSAETLERYEQSGRQSSVVKEYKAALEALFQKKPDAVEKVEALVPSVKVARVVEATTATAEGAPVVPNKRQEMLRKLQMATGSKAISDATDAFLAAGHTLPDDQEVYLQLLDHRDEARVCEAIAKLDQLLMGQLPKRKPVLVQRLKRLEEDAEDPTTRSAATELRRKVG